MILKVKYPRRTDREIVRLSLNKYNLRNVKRYFINKRWLVIRLSKDGSKFAKFRFIIKKNLRHYHGNMTEKQFHKYYKIAFLVKKFRNSGIEFLGILERRLESLMTRMHFSPSVFQSHQLIHHGHVLVEEKKIRNGNFVVGYGQDITINSKSLQMLGELIYTYLKMKILKKNMSLDKKKTLFSMDLKDYGFYNNEIKEDNKTFVHFYYKKEMIKPKVSFLKMDSSNIIGTSSPNLSIHNYMKSLSEDHIIMPYTDIKVNNNHDNLDFIFNIIKDMKIYVTMLIENNMISLENKEELLLELELIILWLMKRKKDDKMLKIFTKYFSDSCLFKEKKLLTSLIWRYVLNDSNKSSLNHVILQNNKMNINEDQGDFNKNMDFFELTHVNNDNNTEDLTINNTYIHTIKNLLNKKNNNFNEINEPLYETYEKLSKKYPIFKYMKLTDKKLKSFITHLIIPNYLMVDYKSMRGMVCKYIQGEEIPYATPIYLDSNFFLHLYENRRLK